MSHYYDTFDTAVGPFSIALDDTGSVVATAFGDAARLSQRFDARELVRDPGRLAAVRIEVEEYFSGARCDFTFPLAAPGTAFQNGVWAALRRIPYGQTLSYGALAARLGNPLASRAVGRANATNPICLIVPCHRVIGADGSLTGFAFGSEIKRRLLEFEREHAHQFDSSPSRVQPAAAAAGFT